MADPSDTLLSPDELRDQLTLGLNKMSIAEAHEEFSERLDNFLDQNNIEESEIISGESEYASILSEAAFNGLDFRGMEGTGLSLADARRIMQDDDYRLEMAEDYLTGNAEERIEKEYTEYTYSPYSRLGLPTAEPMSAEGLEAIEEAVKIKEFMHDEKRDALNSGPEGAPETMHDFEQRLDLDEWMAMEGYQAAFHQNGGAEDLKFIHPDGRELVYDGDTVKIITSDAHMGTYNYVNATIPEDPTPSPLESWQNTRTEGSRLHTAYDVDTWVELGNTRADRYANGGEEARAEQLRDAVISGAVNSTGNSINEGRAWASDRADEVGEAVSDAANEIRDTVGDKIEDIKGFFGSIGSWQEGALNPSHQNMNEAHIQQASVSETEMPTASGIVFLEDAIAMLAADQKALNTPSADGQVSPIQDVINHPDAAQMFQNLQTHGVTTLTAEVAPEMNPEDRASELHLAGQKATQEAGIPMPEEQRQLEATLEHSNSYEDDYSLGL